MLEALEDANESLSQFVGTVPKYITLRENISVKNVQKYSLVSKLEYELKAAFPDFTDFSEVDGVRLALEHGWLLVRASGTEPLIRLTVEGESLTVANDITQRATALIRKQIEAEVK
jgi:phosphoglucosamine mutase